MDFLYFPASNLQCGALSRRPTLQLHPVVPKGSNWIAFRQVWLLISSQPRAYVSVNRQLRQKLVRHIPPLFYTRETTVERLHRIPRNLLESQAQFCPHETPRGLRCRNKLRVKSKRKNRAPGLQKPPNDLPPQTFLYFFLFTYYKLYPLKLLYFLNLSWALYQYNYPSILAHYPRHSTVLSKARGNRPFRSLR